MKRAIRKHENCLSQRSTTNLLVGMAVVWCAGEPAFAQSYRYQQAVLVGIANGKYYPTIEAIRQSIVTGTSVTKVTVHARHATESDRTNWPCPLIDPETRFVVFYDISSLSNDAELLEDGIDRCCDWFVSSVRRHGVGRLVVDGRAYVQKDDFGRAVDLALEDSGGAPVLWIATDHDDYARSGPNQLLERILKQLGPQIPGTPRFVLLAGHTETGTTLRFVGPLVKTNDTKDVGVSSTAAIFHCDPTWEVWAEYKPPVAPRVNVQVADGTSTVAIAACWLPPAPENGVMITAATLAADSSSVKLTVAWFGPQPPNVEWRATLSGSGADSAVDAWNEMLVTGPAWDLHGAALKGASPALVTLDVPEELARLVGDSSSPNLLVWAHNGAGQPLVTRPRRASKSSPTPSKQAP